MSATLPAHIDISGSRPIPFGRLFKVELRKTWDTRAGFWLLASIGLLVLAAEAIYLIVQLVNGDQVDLETAVGVPAMITALLLPVLGIMLVTSEWSQRTAMVTFSLEPRRTLVVWAKMLVGLFLAVLTSVFAFAVGLVVTGIAQVAGHAEWNLSWKFLVGFTLAQALGMLAGFAIAALLLNTPAAIVVYFAYSFVLPGILALGGAAMDWFEKIRPWIDFASAQGPLIDMSFQGKDLGYLLVSGVIWLVLPLFFGVRRILRAEVK
jgi:ABC-2 type transport system permease protein